MASKKSNGHRRRSGKPKNGLDVQKMPVTERQRVFSECSEDSCFVCCNDIDIFAFGRCNHPICHVCLTKTRVLLGTNDCIICRQDIEMVVFSRKRCNFGQMSDQVLPKEKRYKISFEDSSVQKTFDDLLLHKCPICPNKPNFRTFKQLDTHVRREHERFYCELCVSHLKVICMPFADRYII